ncbi:Hypothetical protein CINCED_3A019352, partial [Cinara cedri]
CGKTTDYATYFLINFRCEKLKGLPKKYADYLFDYITPGNIKRPGDFCKSLEENQDHIHNLAHFGFNQYDTTKKTLAYAFYNTGLYYLPSGSFAQKYFKHIMIKVNVDSIHKADGITKFCTGKDKTHIMKESVVTQKSFSKIPSKPGNTKTDNEDDNER